MANRFLVFDTEILDDLVRNDPRWDHPERLTLTIACTVDQDGERRHYFGNRTEIEMMLARMLTYEHVVGFNSTRFDNPVLDGALEKPVGFVTAILGKRHIDLMALMQSSTGRRVSLASVGEGLGIPKTGHGANAPVMWQQGKYQEVIDYCYNDCLVTKAAYIAAATDRRIPYVRKGQMEWANVLVTLRGP